jgi:ABC-type sugar transport system ATPase subunit
MTGLVLSGVSKQFGDAEIIHSTNLEIAPGTLVVFVGPSGCGKSTLLRMIAGLETVTKGNISIGGQDVTDVDPAQRGVAMVFQSYALFPHMTVRQNMGFGMRVKRVPKQEAEARVAQVAEILQVTHLLDRKPAQLSGGQRQRVAIGRAIVREPKVFLFDEPLSNLDAELRVQMRIELAALHDRLKATMIYVTHDQVEAMTLADRIVVLNAGRIEQAGSPLSLYDDPDNLFVAGFLGSPRMNLLDASVTAEGRLALDGLPATIASPIDGLASGSRVVVGCRPEHVVQSDDPDLRLRVRSVEHLGATSFAYAGHGNGTTIAVELRDHRDIRAGSDFPIALPPERCLLFDAETGLRIRSMPGNQQGR